MLATIGRTPQASSAGPQATAEPSANPPSTLQPPMNTAGSSQAAAKSLKPTASASRIPPPKREMPSPTSATNRNNPALVSLDPSTVAEKTNGMSAYAVAPIGRPRSTSTARTKQPMASSNSCVAGPARAYHARATGPYGNGAPG